MWRLSRRLFSDAFFFVRALCDSEPVSINLNGALGTSGIFGIDVFTWYLIAVNAVTLAVCLIYSAFATGESIVDDIATWVINILALAGGAFGMLVGAFLNALAIHKLSDGREKLIRRGDDGNSLLFVISICLCVVWGVAYFIVEGAPWLPPDYRIDSAPMNHIPLIAYLLLVNGPRSFSILLTAETGSASFMPWKFFLWAWLSLVGLLAPCLPWLSRGARKGECISAMGFLSFWA